MRNGKAAAKEQVKREIEREEAISGRDAALLAAAAALEKKAEEPALIDLEGRSGIADFFLLLSGNNEKQVLAIADAVTARLKARGVGILGIEGGDTAQWILIDAGDVVVHVFSAEARLFYDIDGLWSDARRVSIPSGPEAIIEGA